jgi:hypothetical protein
MDRACEMPTHRTLPGRSFRGGAFQALRSRLQSPRLSGTFRHRLRLGPTARVNRSCPMLFIFAPFGTDHDFDRQGPRIKLAPMGFTLGVLSCCSVPCRGARIRPRWATAPVTLLILSATFRVLANGVGSQGKQVKPGLCFLVPFSGCELSGVVSTSSVPRPWRLPR